MNKKDVEKRIREYSEENKDHFNFFDYFAKPISKNDIFDRLNENVILEKDSEFNELGINTLNIYFKLLAQAISLEKDIQTNRNELAYIYYLISYYISGFAHPPSGEKIGRYYIDKAIDLKPTNGKLKVYTNFREEIGAL